jgi:hypothetical protein
MATVYPGNGVVPTSNITIGGGGAGTHTISVTGAGGGGGILTTASGTGSTWANNTNAKLTTKGQMHLEGEDADIVMNGVSLKETLNAITDRLGILQPKPELLAKYENLRQAYEHYKTLEALLHEADDDK